MSNTLDTIRPEEATMPEETQNDPSTGRAYVSRRRARLHRAMTNLDRHGLVDAETMRHFDRTCLTPIRDLTPDVIRAVRLKAGASQAVMAATLNISPKTIEAWEAGTNKPSGLALKILVLAEKNGLGYFR